MCSRFAANPSVSTQFGELHGAPLTLCHTLIKYQQKVAKKFISKNARMVMDADGDSDGDGDGNGDGDGDGDVNAQNSC